jgi:hypothetical protein
MHEDENVSGAPGRSDWMELASGGGVLLRDVTGSLGSRPSPRVPRARRGLLALTTDASSEQRTSATPD